MLTNTGNYFKNLTRAASALCLALVLTAATAAAQQAAPAPSQPAPQQSVAYSSAEASALVTEFDVNGLKVLVKRRAGSQTVVAGLFLRGGAQNVTAETAGIEALMLDAASEASRSYPRASLRKELARMGTGISYGVNYDYSAMTLGTTRYNFDRSWEIFTDVVLHPSFAPEDVERVRNRLVASLRDDNDVPDNYLQVLQARAAYAGHPYLNNPRGTPETMARFTVEDVRRYHAQAMQTSRLLLVLVGDLDPETVRARVAASFGKLPRGDYKPRPLPPLSFPVASVDVTPMPLPTNYVSGVFAAPSPSAPDIYAMRVASSILQQRVFTEVRVRRNLAYSPEAFLSTQGANVGGLYVTTKDINQSVRVMLEEVRKLQTEPVSAEELQSSTQQFLTRYYMGEETNAAQAGELAQYELIGGGWRNAFLFLDRVRAVTPADVQRVARAYMHNLRFVVIGDPRSVDKNIFTGQTGE